MWAAEQAKNKRLRVETRLATHLFNQDKPIPTGTIADAHTHPNALDPKPSGGDQADATRLNLPFYVVTRDAIWKAVPKQDAPVPVAGSDWWKDAWNRDKQGKLKCK